MALTAAARHLGPQLSPLISRTLPDVAPPTTWVARMSFYPPKQRMRCVSGFAFSQPARRHSLPNRVRFTAHRQFASGCSPPRFAATQLPSTTGPWLTPTWTLTMLCTRLHGRTRSPALGAILGGLRGFSRRGRRSYRGKAPILGKPRILWEPRPRGDGSWSARVIATRASLLQRDACVGAEAIDQPLSDVLFHDLATGSSRKLPERKVTTSVSRQPPACSG